MQEAFLGLDVRRDQDELADQLWIFLRRRLEQSREARKQGLLLMVSDDNLDERLAPGLVSENGLYPFKAGERVLAVALRKILLLPCLQ